jgi:hypothetical protein
MGRSRRLVEILAHVPLRGLALKLAHRPFIADRVAGDARQRIGRGQVLGAPSPMLGAIFAKQAHIDVAGDFSAKRGKSLWHMGFVTTP